MNCLCITLKENEYMMYYIYNYNIKTCTLRIYFIRISERQLL